MDSNFLRFDSSGIPGMLSIDAANDKVFIGTTSVANADVFGLRSKSVSSTPVQIVNSANSAVLLAVSEDVSGNGFISLQDITPTSKVLIHTAGVSYFDGGDVAIGRTTAATNTVLTVRGDTAAGGGDYAARFEDQAGALIARFRDDAVVEFGKNIGIGTALFGTNATNTLSVLNGVAPTTSPADIAQIYAAQHSGAGTSTIHIRNEEDDIFKFIKSAAYTPTNVTPTRTFDADSTTLNELADVVGTMIADDQLTGLKG